MFRDFTTTLSGFVGVAIVDGGGSSLTGESLAFAADLGVAEGAIVWMRRPFRAEDGLTQGTINRRVVS